jgi:CheY-like chemotaxis protein
MTNTTRRILLVDDDELFRAMLRRTLANEGYDVVEAANGNEAMKVQRDTPAALLLTDLFMPEKEGLETIQEFRRKHPAVKIIAMTGGGPLNPDDFLAIAKLFGASRTFAKPFANSDLITALEELLPAA